ncbi:fimbrial protein [Pantoea sp. 1.19]|uniref:fimbrial protein n=1 Tax=Pantoea sp. 1.19 TaxID=1925589 RepID=UPI000948FFCD|nr:fimbrial protein [Pantoea sp. 1.19]
MKRSVFPRAGLLLLALGTASLAHAGDVTLTVNGQVVARPCTIATPAATADLGTLSTGDFASAGAASAWQSVALQLTQCPAGTARVTATFSGESDANGYYLNQGSAGNLQLELQNSAGQRLNSGDSQQVAVDADAQSARFPLRVRAVSTQGGATQGSIQAVINVTYTWS